VFASVEARPVEQASRPELGAIGVDINVDHLAVSETDRFGNLIGTRRIALSLYGKTQQQAKALIGDATVSIASQAASSGKPVVMEALDFQKKKAELEAVEPRQARMLSSFACRQITSHLKAACFRAGVEVIEVNPAYTSVMGAVNHAQRHGISVHQGAAFGRRPSRHRVCPNVPPSDRPLCRFAMAATSPSPYLQGIGRSMCGRTGPIFGRNSKRRM
jgi:IS605 OrfB family transposase